MSYSSIHSSSYREYCDKFFSRNDIFSKLNINQLKLLKRYHKWISGVKYKEVMATSNIGNGALFCGLLNNLVTNDINCESGLEQLGCEIKESNGNIRLISLSNLHQIGASEAEIRVINNISEEILSELEYLCYIRDINASDEFEAKNYDKLREVLDKLYDSSRSSEESAVTYSYFLVSAKLPLPLSLVKYYKNELFDLYKQELVRDISLEIMREYNCSQEFMDSVRKSNIYFMSLINDYLKSDKEIDKKRSVLKLGVKFKSVYDKLSNGGRTNFVRLVEASKQTIYYVTTALGERLATKNEIKSIVSGVYKKDVYYLTKEKRDMLLLFGWCVTGEDRYYLMSGIERYKEEFDRVEKLYKEIWSALTWLGSDEFMDKDIKELVKGLKPVEYPDKADDEIKEGSLVDMLKYISENATEDSNYERIALDIAQKCIKYKSYEISEKQSYIVKAVYEKLKRQDEPKEETAPPKELSNGKPNLYDEKLVGKINELLNHPLFSKKDFVAKIIESVTRYKKCSEKQYDIIIDEYNRLGLNKTDAFTAFGLNSQEIETTAKQDVQPKNSFFIDDDDEEPVKPVKDIFGTGGLDSISGMSDMLGLGGVTDSE